MTTISKGGIKYNVSRERDAGFENESRDCFVHALRHATGVPYRDAHAFVADHFKRKLRKGTFKVRSSMLAYAEAKTLFFGYRVFDRTPVPRVSICRSRRTFAYVQTAVYPTLADTLYKLRHGRFLICSNYHAWTVIDGVVFDNGATGNRTRVTECYEFVASSECEAKGI
jgi:hypothetical protein